MGYNSFVRDPESVPSWHLNAVIGCHRTYGPVFFTSYEGNAGNAMAVMRAYNQVGRYRSQKPIKPIFEDAHE